MTVEPSVLRGTIEPARHTQHTQARSGACSPPLFSVSVALGVAIFALSAYFVKGASRFALQHLSAEYYDIALALVDGRGFSDPFGEATGPTAWVPPLDTLLLAGLLLVLKTKAAVTSAVIVIQDLALVGMGVALYSMSRQTLKRVPPVLGVALYLTWLALFHYWFFILTTDIWLIASLATLMALTLVR